MFAVCSLAAGVAQTEGVLIAARLLQGVGAAMMAPAALSILTTTFREGRDRNTALGAWGAISGLAAAAGVFLGGVLSEGPGWRWVFYVNVPVVRCWRWSRRSGCCRASVGARRWRTSTRRARCMATGGMLLLVYGLITAPDVGWSTARTIGMLAAAALILLAFLANERRSRNPLVPLSIFRIEGLAAADATWLIGMARLLLDVLLPHSVHAGGPAFLADPGRRGVPARDGVPGARIGRLLATVLAHRHPAGDRFRRSPERRRDLLPIEDFAARLLRARPAPRIGDDVARVRRVFVGVTTAANAGVPASKAGLAAGLLATSQQLGMALGSRCCPRSPPPARMICSRPARRDPRRSPPGISARCWCAASSSSPPR